MSPRSIVPLIAAMLLLTSWAAVLYEPQVSVFETAVSHAGGAEPAGGTLTDNGDGTSTYSITLGTSSELYDTWLSAAQSSTNFGNDSKLKVGYSNNDSSRWNTLFGVDLDAAGFWTNTSILQADLVLHTRQVQGTPTIRSWVCYDSDWQEDSVTWSGWQVGGALGNLDSGGLMEEKSGLTGLNFTSFDVTRAVDIAHHSRFGGPSEPASILLTGPVWGDEWVTFDSVDFAFASERPKLNITFTWGTPSSLPTTTQWVDIYPKEPHRIDADSQLSLEATARSGEGDVKGGSVTWLTDIGTIDAGGQFTPDITGVAKIEAIVNGVPGEMNLQVTAGTPVSLTISPETAQITVDHNISFSASLQDAMGNEVEGAAITWHSDNGYIDANGNYTPIAVGDDIVTVLWQSLYDSADITVSAGAAANITFGEGLTVAAGEQLPLIFTVSDRTGNPLPNQAAGSIAWVAENGFIDGIGVFTGDAVGTWRINATGSSGAVGHTFVEVTQGTLADLEIVEPNGSQPADQPVLLVVLWLDVRGNRVPVRIPLTNWTAEDGNFRMTPEGVEWLPRREGNWTVGVHVQDRWVNVTISVVHGNASRLLIVSDYETITADDVIGLELQAEDTKGNRWLIAGNWTAMEPQAAPWLSETPNGAVFEGVIAGIWTIRAEHDSPDGSFSTFLMLEVLPGSLARIELEGHGEQISADGSFDFSPRFFDEDGNELEEVTLNWTFRHQGEAYDRTGDLRSNDAVWYPVLAGHHEVEVQAAGVFAAIGIDVEPGIPHTLRTLNEGVVVVRSGESTQIDINATDLDGNDFGSDVLWYVPVDSVDMANGTREGAYLLRGLREGTHILRFTSGLAEGEIVVTVELGEPVRVELHIPDHAIRTGYQIDIEVRIYDFGGNRLSSNPDNVLLTSGAGTFVHDVGDHWQLYLENSGEQQRVQIDYGPVGGEIFIDVEADPLYAFGDSSLATALWTGVAGVVLLFGLLLMLLRSRSRREEEAMLEYFEDDESRQVDDAAAELAAYKPSKKARRAAREAFQQMSQTMPQQYAGQQATQQVAAQQQAAAHYSGAQQTVPQQEISLEEVPSAPAGEVWSTEQLWAWGRSQGWSDEQIGIYEEYYDSSVRKTSTQTSTAAEQSTETVVTELAQDTFSMANSTSPVAQPVTTEQVTGPSPTAAEPALEAVPESVSETVPESASESVSEPVPDSATKMKVDIREKGIMKAMPGTEQGQAGWYLDGEGNPSRWDIDDDGTWHRTG
uniref:Ig domain-containing protein n=1 Tax=uncultured marine group II/III euryarchaeote KM3_192_D09 TaxID=1457965 RepID=A0A075GU68_9EURY|nr:Ig domain-containing protein [uncultured marine group II/III euryarchaeote KM3_192_D09]